jgi:hypothetical protein
VQSLRQFVSFETPVLYFLMGSLGEAAEFTLVDLHAVNRVREVIGQGPEALVVSRVGSVSARLAWWRRDWMS